MAQVDYTVVRVHVDTLDMLHVERESMILGDEMRRNPLDCPACNPGEPDTRERIGLDLVIRRLVEFRREHRRRRRAAARKRRLRGRLEGSAGGEA